MRCFGPSPGSFAVIVLVDLDVFNFGNSTHGESLDNSSEFFESLNSTSSFFESLHNANVRGTRRREKKSGARHNDATSTRGKMTSKNFDHPFKRSQIDRPEQADPTMIANELDELTEGSIISTSLRFRLAWFTQLMFQKHLIGVQLSDARRSTYRHRHLVQLKMSNLINYLMESFELLFRAKT